MDDNIKVLAEGLIECYEKMYWICYPMVQRIIQYKIEDTDIIEHTLDQTLDIYTEKGFNLFIKLLLYYKTVDLEKTYAYLKILKEERMDEYDEFVKKYKKEK